MEPLIGILAVAGTAVFVGVLGARAEAARHAWTAQSVMMGIAVVLTLVGAAVGHVVGYAAREQRRQGRWAAVAGIWVALAVGLFWGVTRVQANIREGQRLAAIREEILLVERARALFAGSREERLSLAYNKTCPPELLAEMARDRDESIRATVGGNASTPPAVVEDLAKDSSELVRQYVQWNPARKRSQ